jgi:hypothetical protein
MREQGYYWVRFTSSDWFIAEWRDSIWIYEDNLVLFDDHTDSDFEEIDERRIVREEPTIEEDDTRI